MLLKLISFALFYLPFASCQNSSSDYVIDLGYTKYRGALNDSFPNIVNYYNIRYAAPPLGSLRWQAPMDIESHTSMSNTSSIQDATVRGPTCVQGVPYWRQTISPSGSEDCLLLDVLVPKTPASAYLPVLVQIHGGGYLQGNSQSSPGYMLVNQSQGNLIYVSIQYRLSAFGFLSSSAIRENGAANAGLLDQRAALGWVQRHIRSFGGDPAKVTIIGGSAGGSSVMNQMILYGGVSNPPFRAAIAEYPWWQSYKNGTVLEAQYRQMLNATGCDGLECLRGQSTQNLIDASQSAFNAGWEGGWYGWGDFYFGPSVDGEAIRDLPSNEFKKGNFVKVPLVVNRDAYEGYNYSPPDNTTEEMTADLQTIFPYAKQSFFRRLYELYPAGDFNSTFFRRAEIYGDYIINCRK
ncbi:hypothetical protein LTR37_014005 [Vermiconidia calcicola]|uniref:Uncharacterized protein n=1 Tax=Vermiconidia calcicola TaxID=1690605 RepID=A0ACC3MUQ7_9PEZI|nr:hypothetical protein LTR37_014005 [Vermiconidia calcicola]